MERAAPFKGAATRKQGLRGADALRCVKRVLRECAQLRAERDLSFDANRQSHGKRVQSKKNKSILLFSCAAPTFCAPLAPRPSRSPSEGYPAKTALFRAHARKNANNAESLPHCPVKRARVCTKRGLNELSAPFSVRPQPRLGIALAYTATSLLYKAAFHSMAHSASMLVCNGAMFSCARTRMSAI